MKRFLASVLIAALGILTLGCENQKGTTENKTETTTSQTKNGETTGATTTTVDTKTITTPATARRWRHDDRKDDQKNDRDDHRDEQVVRAMCGRLTIDGRWRCAFKAHRNHFFARRRSDGWVRILNQ